MITRHDLNEESFEKFIRQSLIEQLVDLETTINDDSIRDDKLVEAFNRVIAYNSIPGTWKNGEFDY